MTKNERFENLIMSSLNSGDGRKRLVEHFDNLTQLSINEPHFDGPWNAESYENRVPIELVKELRVILDNGIEEISNEIATLYGVKQEDLLDGYFLQRISREVYRQKYAIHDNEGNRLEEDVFESLIRIAVAVSSVELRTGPTETAIDYFVKFFTMMALKQFSGGGRIMANAGANFYKNNTTLINCTVMEQIPDSIEGIMDVAKQAALSLKAGAGVGYNFSTIRPKGAFVRGSGAETSGVISFMEIFDKTCSTIMSAGGRRGAQMATLHIEHPEIRQFISAKREDGVLRYFNLSVLPTDSFMEAVENDTEIDLWFWERSDKTISEVASVKIIERGDVPYNHPGDEYFEFAEDHVEVKYGNAAPKEIFQKRVYETIRAREMMDLIMESTYEFAEPGFILIDRINEMNPLAPYGEHIQATNPCVTGDTLVPTSHGLVRIDSLVDSGEFETIVDHRPVADVRGTGAQTARAVYSGEKAVFEVVTERGYRVRTTADHRFYTDKGYRELQELAAGKRVAIQSGPNMLRERGEIEETDSADGLVLGSFLHNGEIVHSGEGEETRKGYKFTFSAFEQIVSTTVHDRIMQMFGEETSTLDYTVEHDDDTKTNFITYFDERVVSWFEERGFTDSISVTEYITSCNHKLLGGFLQGVFGTLGGLHLVDSREFPARFQNKKGAFFRDGEVARLVHLLLLDAGVIATIDEANGFYVISAEKNQTLEFYVIYDKIKSITSAGIEAVYDLQVDMAHTFIANGMVVHNCGEQPLPNNGSCNLGSLFLNSFVLDPFQGNNTYFDWPTYRYVIELGNRFLDNVNDITNLPLESLRYQAWYKRRHGLGVTGVADTLAALGHVYGTESEDLLDDIFYTLGYQSVLSSYRLAEEKGAAPIFAQEGASKIVLSKYLDEIIEGTSDDEWTELEPYVSDHKPMRFSHATSIAPTGTMSLTWGDNVANGIEPTFSHYYMRNIRIPGKLAKVQERVYSLGYLWYLSINGIEHRDDLELPHFLPVTNDVSVDGHIAVQSAAQRWIDSSVSKTCNVPTDYDFQDFKDAYMRAWKNGLKGFTTFRFNPNFSVGVLTRDEDLRNTYYEFQYDNNNSGEPSTIRVRGDESVVYKGETMNAANLYEALKEKLFGKM